jgi:hypothetical protein
MVQDVSAITQRTEARVAGSKSLVFNMAGIGYLD